jgi:hypothetical protein
MHNCDTRSEAVPGRSWCTTATHVARQLQGTGQGILRYGIALEVLVHTCDTHSEAVPGRSWCTRATHVAIQHLGSAQGIALEVLVHTLV